jgi:hypothetical protein
VERAVVRDVGGRVRLTGPDDAGARLRDVLDLCAGLPGDLADRDLSADLDTAGDLLDDLADTLDAT